MPTAHHLVWLCCVEYLDLFPEDAADKSGVCLHAEFNVTLYSATGLSDGSKEVCYPPMS